MAVAGIAREASRQGRCEDAGLSASRSPTTASRQNRAPKRKNQHAEP
jgi:hypothetical protein